MGSWAGRAPEKQHETPEGMNLVEIGRVVRPHGLQGFLKVSSFLADAAFLQDAGEAYVGRRGREPRRLRIQKVVLSNARFFLLKLEGVEDRNAAAALAGEGIFVVSDRLEALAEGEFYWRDLIGLQVETEEGERLGEIRAVFPTGSNDVYVCGGGQREILIPAIAEVIRKVDVPRGVMIVRLLKGL